jgi:hypothetical protein
MRKSSAFASSNTFLRIFPKAILECVFWLSFAVIDRIFPSPDFQNNFQDQRPFYEQFQFLEFWETV